MIIDNDDDTDRERTGGNVDDEDVADEVRGNREIVKRWMTKK